VLAQLRDGLAAYAFMLGYSSLSTLLPHHVAALAQLRDGVTAVQIQGIFEAAGGHQAGV
jgi:hypothetical protein